MGALAPIANLIGFSTGGALGAGGQRGQTSTPPLDNFFGLGGDFLRAPAGGTALMNSILFGSSNQQVPIDFMRLGFYSGVPPLFGGAPFGGLPARFDFFSGSRGPVGVDAILQLERAINGGGSLADLVGGAGTARANNAGSGGTAGNKGASASKDTAKAPESVKVADLKQMSLGDLVKLLLA